MKLLLKEYDLGFLSAQCDGIEFHMFRSDDSLSYISCIACLCERASDIIKHWRAIQGFVSVHYQPKGNLASWNLYLAYVTTQKLSLWQKYEIENNKFSARKVVLDGCSEMPTPDQLAVELEKQLLGSDLTLDSRVNEPREALLSLEEFVRGAPLDQKVESKEKRASMINNIIEFLNKDENQKS